MNPFPGPSLPPSLTFEIIWLDDAAGKVITIHRCAECGYYEGESPQGGCCPNCGTASDPIPVNVREVGYGEPEIIGRETIQRYNLDAAIATASNKLAHLKGKAAQARGFFVRGLREEERS